MDTWLRVLVYVVLAIAPTALFLGLWNGLNRMRDDELTQAALERADSSPARSTFAGRVLFSHADQRRRVDLDGLSGDGGGPSGGGGSTSGGGGSTSGGGTGGSADAPGERAGSPTGADDGDGADADPLREPVVCEACGAPNDPEFDRCAECLAEL